MPKYRENLPISDLEESDEELFILFESNENIMISRENITGKLLLSQNIYCLDFCFYLCGFFKFEIFSIFLHLFLKRPNESSIFSLEKFAKFRDIFCMLIEICFFEKAWCWTESDIIIHTWRCFPCFISDVYGRWIRIM